MARRGVVYKLASTAEDGTQWIPVYYKEVSGGVEVIGVGEDISRREEVNKHLRKLIGKRFRSEYELNDYLNGDSVIGFRIG